MNIARHLIGFTGLTFCLIACTKSDPPVTTTPTPAVPRYTVTTIAGSVVGYKDGPALDARFLLPLGLTVDVQGNILVADADANRIRKITPSGIVSTFAGSSPIQGYLDGPASIAKFNHPTDVELDAQGNVLVCDAGNNLIRRISPIGVVSTFAGSTIGLVNGPGTQARFDGPVFMAMDANQNIIIGEGFNHSIRKITPAAFVTTVSGNFNYPLFTMHLDGTFSTAKFELPSGVDIDAYGNIYVADTDGHCIRKLGINGIVTTIAGGTRGFKDGKGAEAQFCWPADVAVDAEGNVYVTDTSNNRIRKIAADGTVTTIAGNGGSNVGGAYKDGVGVLASFNRPWGITIDMEGNLIVSDSWNGLIRKITMK